MLPLIPILVAVVAIGALAGRSRGGASSPPSLPPSRSDETPSVSGGRRSRGSRRHGGHAPYARALLVLQGYLRAGRRPPREVALAALVEARHAGHHQLADEIARTWISDAGGYEYGHGYEYQAAPSPMPTAPVFYGTPADPYAGSYGSPPGSPAYPGYDPGYGAPPGAYAPPSGPLVDGNSSPPAYAPPPSYAPPPPPQPSSPPGAYAYAPGSSPIQDSPSPSLPPSPSLIPASFSPQASDEEILRALAQATGGGQPQTAAGPPPPLPPDAPTPGGPGTITVSGRSSPIDGVGTSEWAAFLGRVSRELPTYTAQSHVGQFRQRRDRLRELGIDDRAVESSPDAQRRALDADMQDAYSRAYHAGLLGCVGRVVDVPAPDGSHRPVQVTTSGVLGVIQAAGLDGAAGWFRDAGDRVRFPNTSAAFARTNGVF